MTAQQIVTNVKMVLRTLTGQNGDFVTLHAFGTEFTVTLFVFLTTSTGTWVVRTRFLIHVDRFGPCVLTGVTTGSLGSTRSLRRLLYRIFLRTIAAIVHTALLLCLLHFIGFGHMDLTT